MNVLFLNPPYMPNFSRGQRSPQVTKSGTFYYPIWLAYAVADRIGGCDPCPSDHDDNGQVGFEDLLALLRTWGPCPE